MTLNNSVRHCEPQAKQSRKKMLAFMSLRGNAEKSKHKNRSNSDKYNEVLIPFIDLIDKLFYLSADSIRIATVIIHQYRKQQQAVLFGEQISA